MEIQVNTYFVSEYYSLRSLNSIILDKYIGEGNYGIVYSSKYLNNNNVEPLAVKIFDKSKDATLSSERCYNTILNLQKKASDYNVKLKQDNKKIIEEVNALKALPLFSFEGYFNGNKVLGYASYLLNSGFIEFDKLFNNPDNNEKSLFRKQFYNDLTLKDKYKFAYDLVEGFVYLRDIGFIHADLNPKNFFINLQKKSLVIIDFDGGAVTTGNEYPETMGKRGTWQAPEIQEQNLQNLPLIKVDLSTDTWAVMLAIHHLLFPAHPLFYLQKLGKKEIAEYFNKYKWPNISKSDSNFRLEKTYNSYINFLQSIDKNILRAFEATINNGFYQPASRLEYKNWLVYLEKLSGVKKRKIYKTPQIKLSHSLIKFDTLSINRTITKFITVSNIGIGNLEWSVSSKSDILTTIRRGNDLEVKAKPPFFKSGKFYEKIRIESNGGRADISVTGQIKTHWFVALISHLLFGLGLFYIDKEVSRKWIYPLIIIYSIIDILLAINGVKPFKNGFGGISLLVCIIIYLLSFIDVFVTMHNKNKILL